MVTLLKLTNGTKVTFEHATRTYGVYHANGITTFGDNYFQAYAFAVAQPFPA